MFPVRLAVLFNIEMPPKLFVPIVLSVIRFPVLPFTDIPKPEFPIIVFPAKLPELLDMEIPSSELV